MVGNYLSRKEVENDIRKYYAETYTNLKYYLVNKSYCDIFENDTWESLKDFYNQYTVEYMTDSYGLQHEDTSFKLLRYNYEFYNSSYEKLSTTYSDFYYKILTLFNYIPLTNNVDLYKADISTLENYKTVIKCHKNNDITVDQEIIYNVVKALYKDKIDKDNGNVDDLYIKVINQEILEIKQRIKDHIKNYNETVSHFEHTKRDYILDNETLECYVPDNSIKGTNDRIALNYHIYKEKLELLSKFNIELVGNIDTINPKKTSTLYIDKNHYAYIYTDKDGLISLSSVRQFVIDNNDAQLEINKLHNFTFNLIQDSIGKIHLPINNTRIDDSKDYLQVGTRDDIYNVEYANQFFYKNILNNELGMYYSTKIDTSFASTSNIVTANNKYEYKNQIKNFNYRLINVKKAFDLTRFYINKTYFDPYIARTYFIGTKKIPKLIGLSKSEVAANVTIKQTLGETKNDPTVRNYVIAAPTQTTVNSFGLNHADNFNIKAFDKIDAHRIYLTEISDISKYYNIPNPNYIELKSYKIVRDMHDPMDYNYKLLMDFTDEDQLTDDLIDIKDYEIARLREPTVMYPTKVNIENNIASVTYYGGFKAQLLYDNQSTFNFTLDFDNTSGKATFKYNNRYTYTPTTITNNIGTWEFIQKAPDKIDHIQYSNGILGTNISPKECDLSSYVNVSTTYVKSNKYTYKLVNDIDNTNFINIVEDQDTTRKYRLSYTKVNDITITNIIRDIDNEKIIIKYSDGTQSEYHDLLDRNFIYNVYNINSYNYEDSILTKTTYLNNDQINTRYNFKQYEKYLHRINTITTDDNYVSFYESNNFIDTIEIPSNNRYTITYEVINQLKYDYYDDLSLNKIIDNQYLICRAYNRSVLHQTFSSNLKGREESYNINLNSGNGFALVYDNYSIDLESKELNAHTIKNVSGVDFLKVNKNELLKFNGPFVELPLIVTHSSDGENMICKGTNYTGIKSLRLEQNSGVRGWLWGDNDHCIEAYKVKGSSNYIATDRKYDLTVKVNKLIADSWNDNDDNHNKWALKIVYYDFKGKSGVEFTNLDVDWTKNMGEYYFTSASDYSQADMYTYTFHFAPKYNNFKLYPGIYTNGKERVFTEFWDFSLVETKDLKFEDGLYVTL